jgi:hypothetical protein
LLKATYGQAWNFWPFKAAEATATNYITAQVPDNIIFVGTKAGKGVIWRGALGLATNALVFNTLDTSIFTVNTTSGVVSVSEPTLGAGQFKGVTYSTNE